MSQEGLSEDQWRLFNRASTVAAVHRELDLDWLPSEVTDRFLLTIDVYCKAGAEILPDGLTSIEREIDASTYSKKFGFKALSIKVPHLVALYLRSILMHGVETGFIKAVSEKEAQEAYGEWKRGIRLM